MSIANDLLLLNTYYPLLLTILVVENYSTALVKYDMFSIGTELSHLAIERNIDSHDQDYCASTLEYILGNSTISCFLYRSQGS